MRARWSPAASIPASPIPAPPRCISSRRSTASPDCAACSAWPRPWSPVAPTATRAWRASRRRRCSTAARAWAMRSPTCTTRSARIRRSSTSSATMPPTTGRTMRRSPRTPKASRAPCRPGCAPATSARAVGADAAAAVQAARTPPGGTATLILPADCAWNEGAEPGAPLAPPAARRGAGRRRSRTIAQRAALGPAVDAGALRCGAWTKRGLRAANRIAHATGAKLRTPTQIPRMARGRGRVPVDRIPYVVDAALKVLEGTQASRARGREGAGRFLRLSGQAVDAVAGGLRRAHARDASSRTSSARCEALADELARAARRADARRCGASRSCTAGPSSPRPSA